MASEDTTIKTCKLSDIATIKSIKLYQFQANDLLITDKFWGAWMSNPDSSSPCPYYVALAANDIPEEFTRLLFNPANLSGPEIPAQKITFGLNEHMLNQPEKTRPASRDNLFPTVEDFESANEKWNQLFPANVPISVLGSFVGRS